MKTFFILFVLFYNLLSDVYGAKVATKNIIVEQIKYDQDTFWKAGDYQSVYCKGSSKNIKVHWIDPSGKVVSNNQTSRVYVHHYFVQSMRGAKVPALILNFQKLSVDDSGTYECRSGNSTDHANVCVIDPLEFVEKSSEVTASIGRSITLTCEAIGNPEPTLVWQRNDEIIDESSNEGKYKVMPKFNSHGFEGMLTITSLEPDDSGVYSCIASQEIKTIDNCRHLAINNITLQVNYPPSFNDGNDTEIIYVLNNQRVNLSCSAKGYPTPIYRWFKDDNDTLVEYSDKLITKNEDGHGAVLSLVANPSTFEQYFMCQASNDHGDVKKYYVIIMLEKPETPSEVRFYNSTESQIHLQVFWKEHVLFPIGGYDIQYLKETGTRKSDRSPNEDEWKSGTQDKVEGAERPDIDTEFDDFTVILKNMEPESKYWVRLRVINEAGQSGWSKPVLASTDSTPQITTTNESSIDNSTTTKSDTDVETAGDTKDGAVPNTDTKFYGIFFAGGVLVVAIVYMLLIRMV